MQNLLCRAGPSAFWSAGPSTVRSGLAQFPGVEHRLELFLTWKGVRIYNDSAATIPDATAAAVRAVQGPIVLLTGGTDKNIDFSPLRDVAKIPRNIVLLAGTGTDKIKVLLRDAHASWDGPYDNLKDALVRRWRWRSRHGASPAEVHSQDHSRVQGRPCCFPGCTSFGMFLTSSTGAGSSRISRPR